MSYDHSEEAHPYVVFNKEQEEGYYALPQATLPVRQWDSELDVGLAHPTPRRALQDANVDYFYSPVGHFDTYVEFIRKTIPRERSRLPP